MCASSQKQPPINRDIETPTAPGQAPYISIIVPIYKVEDYIGACLDSIIAQTYTRFEVICVDDGSPDNSADIVSAFQKRDERIRLIHQENQGLSAARNTGIAQSSGDVVMFVDSDDTIVPHALERVAAMFEKHSPDVVVFGARCVPEEKADPWINDILSPKDEVIDGYYIEMLFNKAANPFAWRIACSHSFLEEFDLKFSGQLKFGEDQLFCMMLYTHTRKTVLMSDKLYNYTVARTGSLMDRISHDLRLKISHHLDIVRVTLEQFQARGMLKDPNFKWLAIRWMNVFVFLDITRLKDEPYREFCQKFSEIVRTFFTEDDIHSTLELSRRAFWVYKQCVFRDNPPTGVVKYLLSLMLFSSIYLMRSYPKDVIVRKWYARKVAREQSALRASAEH